MIISPQAQQQMENWINKINNSKKLKERLAKDRNAAKIYYAIRKIHAESKLRELEDKRSEK